MNINNSFTMIGGCTLRGLQYGAGFGILVGTVMFPGIGSVYGVTIGAVEGLIYGLVNGLIMVLITYALQLNSGSARHTCARLITTLATTAALMAAAHVFLNNYRDLELWDLQTSWYFACPVMISAILLANRISHAYNTSRPIISTSTETQQ